MKRLLFVLLMAVPAFAADFEAGIRHVVMMPMGDSGTLDIPLSRGFAATGEVFWTGSISTQFAASFVNPEAILYPPNAEPVDLGTLGIDTYSVTARYHFSPQTRFSAYAGGGGALVLIGNLDDQFGDAVLIEYDSQIAFLAEAGVRYRFRPRIFVDVGVTYMPLRADGEIELNVDPLTVSGGIAWRF